MNIEIEEVGPCKKLLKFEIPKETIERRVAKTVKRGVQNGQFAWFQEGKSSQEAS